MCIRALKIQLEQRQNELLPMNSKLLVILKQQVEAKIQREAANATIQNNSEITESRRGVGELGEKTVDLQKKNMELNDEIKTRSYGDYFTDDFVNEEAVETTPHAKPTLHLCMFRDICDIFDKHDAKTCPLPSSCCRAHRWQKRVRCIKKS